MIIFLQLDLRVSFLNTHILYFCKDNKLIKLKRNMDKNLLK